MSAASELRMLEAIRDHIISEAVFSGDPRVNPSILRAVEVRVVAENDNDPASGRAIYRSGETWSDIALVTGPYTTLGGAEPPYIRNHAGIHALRRTAED